jgi:hypothetical protein
MWNFESPSLLKHIWESVKMEMLKPYTSTVINPNKLLGSALESYICMVDHSRYMFWMSNSSSPSMVLP